MNRRRTIVIAALLLASACQGDRGKLEIRSIPTAVASGERPVTVRVAEARAQFALGNVGLALESFRKAAREDPDNVDALSGVAACYDQMGRFDLSRRNYEAALAVSPGDPQLLAAFAASLDLQHLAVEAASVRREIDQRLAEAAVPARVASPVPAAPDQAPAPAPVAAALQPVLRTTVANAVAAAIAAGRWPVDSPSARRAGRDPAPGSGPRLERLSLGEVALITTLGPRWRVQGAQAAPARVVRSGAAAIRQAVAEGSELRLLNAARVDRLASRTRAYLSGRGWAVATVGDELLIRRRSIIFYPLDKRAAAARLSAHFGFAMQPRSDMRQITILLGRDAARLPMLRAKGG